MNCDSYESLDRLIIEVSSLHAIENNEMGRACGAYRGEEMCAQGSGEET